MKTTLENFNTGPEWTVTTAHQALPILLLLAKTERMCTYGELSDEVVRRNYLAPRKGTRGYGRVLFQIGRALNQLSEEWRHGEIPPLTILVKKAGTEEPGDGFDEFLQRFVAEEKAGRLTPHNRSELIRLGLDAVYNYRYWDQVAEYFGVRIPTEQIIDRSHARPIMLPAATVSMGVESQAHRDLKQYVADHPELFSRIGKFQPGTTEYRLCSGDEVDVLFSNDEQTLAVEVKTDQAPGGEITRGIFQCVKYRAVLRAMHAIKGELKNVQVVLATPQQLVGPYKEALDRFGIELKRVQVTQRLHASEQASKDGVA